MGGFTQALSEIGSKISTGLRDYVGNMSKEANFEHPQWGHIDKGLMEAAEKYTRVRQQSMEELRKPVDELWRGIKGDPALDAVHGNNKSTLGQIHADLVSKGSALSNHSQILLNRSPNNLGKTLVDLSGQIPSEARLIAQRQALGEHNEYITPLFYELYNSPDPTAWSHADAMANIFSSMTHDKSEFRMKRGTGGERSQTKFDIQEAIKKIDKVKGQTSQLPKDLKFIYHSPSGRERALNAWVHTVVAPFIAIPHIGTAFNLASAPLSSISKGLLSMRDSAFRDTIAKTGILASTMHSIMDTSLRYEAGMTGQVVGHKAANIISKIMHNPGFQHVRLSQLMFGGAVGYHAIQEWGELAVKGNKRATTELALLHLDPQAIIRRGGKITDDELGNAIYHFVNDRFFIDKTLTRSLYSNANKWMRTATMFHAFVGYQSAFIKNELIKLVKTKDWMSLAQYAGTLGILFPAVAPLMKSAEMLLRTGSPEQAGEGIKEDYQTLTGQNNADGKMMLFKYIEMLSYLGAYGVYSHYLQSAEHNRLAQQMLGPVIGTAVTTTQDIVTGIRGSRRGHNFAPLGRDVLRYGVPVAGAALEHQLLPPKRKRRR